jgi:carbon monoxide dehydrogenase subunit G
MEFTNSFAVDVPLDRVWTLFLDARQVAPCVPGAELTESLDNTHHKGTVKVKLGAVQMTYRGELEMEPDESTRTIVLRARGSESRGGGGASGTFTTTLMPTESGGTAVEIHTRVDVTGRVAQFGRGIMQDVANRMIKDFATCLERKVSERGQAAGAPTAPDAASEASAPAGPATTAPTGIARTSSPAPAPPPPPAQPQPASNELRIGKLLLDVTRSRVADGLRLLAKLIEP